MRTPSGCSIDPGTAALKEQRLTRFPIFSADIFRRASRRSRKQLILPFRNKSLQWSRRPSRRGVDRNQMLMMKKPAALPLLQVMPLPPDTGKRAVSRRERPLKIPLLTYHGGDCTGSRFGQLATNAATPVQTVSFREARGRNPAANVWFALKGTEPHPLFAFAGVWRDEQPGVGGKRGAWRTHAMLMTTANALVRLCIRRRCR